MALTSDAGPKRLMEPDAATRLRDDCGFLITDKAELSDMDTFSSCEDKFALAFVTVNDMFSEDHLCLDFRSSGEF